VVRLLFFPNDFNQEKLFSSHSIALSRKTFSSSLTKRPITFLLGNPAFFTLRHHGVCLSSNYYTFGLPVH